MGSSKKQTVGYRYYLGLHFGICHGPVDSVQRIRVGDRDAWVGDVRNSDTIAINSPELFGGDNKEGGIAGSLDLLMGSLSQSANSYLSSKLGGAIPAFRGILSAVWKGGQVSANNPYIKPWSFLVTRINAGWQDGVLWHPTKAAVDLQLKTKRDLNDSQLMVFPRIDETYSYYNVSGWPRSGVSGLDFDAYQTNGSFSNCVALWGSSPEYDFAEGEDFAIEFKCFLTDSAGLSINLGHVVFGRIWVRATNYTGGYIIEDAPWWFRNKFGNMTFISPICSQIQCPITLNQWVKYRVERTGTTLRMFKDDIEVASVSCTTAALVSNAPITVNGPYQTFAPLPNNFGNGVIQRFSDLKIYRGFAVPEPDYFTMNPAHIIYECLTNNSWGMGYPTSAIDDAKFTAAADTLFAEGFGLCMIWNRQETIENFIKLVLEHAGGILYVDPTTGKFALKLIRDDYVAGTLQVFGPSNLVAASDYQRKAWGETVNEVTVVFRDVRTNKDASVTVQDLANIQTQGAVVAQTKQYPGIPATSLAQRVAMRDMNMLSTPLARVKLTANRKAWALIPGDVFRLNWPDFGVADVVFRVLEVNRGTLQDGTISIDAVEDVFGLPSNTYVVEQPGKWMEPTSQPLPASSRKIIETPYWDLALSLSAADLAYIDPLSGYIETLAARPSGDSINYEINTKTGAAEYAERTVAEFCPTATLSSAISKTATAITFSDAVDVDLVAAGGYGIIGDEYVGITAVDATAGTATITRGLLDTVPSDHAIGARVWFADGYQGSDQTEYASGELLSVKLLPRTGMGELAIGGAPADSITITRRHNRPYPPGLFRVSGQAYPVGLVDVALSASWAHRDRLTQTAYLVPQSDGNIGPEAGTTYTVQLWNHATGTLIEGFTGVAGTSQAFASLPAGAYTLRVDLWSVRGGLASYQKQSHVFAYININILNTENLDRIATESGDVIALE